MVIVSSFEIRASSFRAAWRGPSPAEWSPREAVRHRQREALAEGRGPGDPSQSKCAFTAPAQASSNTHSDTEYVPGGNGARGKRCDIDNAKHWPTMRSIGRHAEDREIRVNRSACYRYRTGIIQHAQKHRIRPRRESNPHQRFRKPPFYPLNYGDRRLRIVDFGLRIGNEQVTPQDRFERSVYIWSSAGSLSEFGVRRSMFGVRRLLPVLLQSLRSIR